MALIGWIRRHPLVSYFAAVFIISWGTELALLLSTIGVPAPVTAFAMEGGVFAGAIATLLLGPPIASLTMTALTDGRAGLRDLRRRLTHTRLPARDYALALIAPVTLLVILAVLTLIDPAYRPGFLTAPGSAITVGFAYSMAAGFFEELGWTGFATPRLVARFGVIRGGLVLGVIWTVWHILPVWAFSWTSYGFLYFGNLLQSLIFLTSFRVLMTVTWARTGSLFLAMVLHVSLTFATTVIGPAATTPEQVMLWNSLWPLALAGAALIVAGVRLPALRRLRHA